MSDKVIFATNVDTGDKVGIEVEDIIEHRMQVLAGSGAGKSHILRAFCESGYGKFQQIIIGPKVEFVTLREKFDYLHIGKSSEINRADIELNTRYAGQLALKLLESGTNAVIEFSQAPLERVKYVRNFVESLMSSPMNLWHPVMVLIDEIDIWAPEKGHGEAESLNAIADLAARGRDKGFFLVAATQNLAKFNKDVASELDIKLVGKVTLDVHQTRAAQELGIASKDKGQLRLLGKPNYHFYAFGPGISDEIIKIKSLPVQTTHVSGYKRNKNFKPIPTPEKIKHIITSFSDLPVEAEKELKTKEDLQKHIKELTVRLQKAERQQISSSPKIDPAALQQAEQRGFQKGIQHATIQFNKFEASLKNYIRTFKPIIQRAANMGAELAKLQEIIPDIEQTIQTKLDLKLPTLPIEAITPAPKVITNSATPIISAGQLLKVKSSSDDQALSGPEEKILKGLLSLPNQRGTKIQVAFAGGYTNAQGGGFRNPAGSLRTKGFLEYEGELIVATDAAKAMFPDVEQMPLDTDSIQKFWLNLLPGPEQKILKPIMEAYPNPISRMDTATAAGYTNIQAGGFRNPVGHLRSLGLIDYVGKDNDLIASKELFPE